MFDILQLLRTHSCASLLREWLEVWHSSLASILQYEKFSKRLVSFSHIVEQVQNLTHKVWWYFEYESGQDLECFCIEFNKYKVYLFSTHFVQTTEA